MQRWGGCRAAEELRGCRMVTGIGVAAGLQKSCGDAGWLQGCRVVALMQGACRDGVTAEMGVVAGMQGGCIDARWLQG